MNKVPLLNQSWAGYPERLPLRILQFGAGNFMRAFVDWMVDILNEEAEFNAGVIVVKPTANGNYKDLREQDGLFHVLIRGLQHGQTVETHRLVDCVQEVIHPYRDWEGFLATAEIKSLNIITSNTTEAGIEYVAADRFEDAPPVSFPAKLTGWLYRRFVHFSGAPGTGCTLLPCELIEGNGDELKAVVLRYAAQWGLGSAFEDWLLSSNTFVNTLVDRIVTGYPDDGLDYSRHTLSCEDRLLVTAEPFYLWALEKPAGRASVFPLQRCPEPLHIRIVDDLQPIRMQKVRILNGLHTIMVAVGLTHGFTTVEQITKDSRWGDYLRRTAESAILPVLPLPEEELQAYLSATFERFLNPFVAHRLQAIALNSIVKFRVRVLPSMLAYREQFGLPAQELAYAFACLLQLYNSETPAFRDTSEAAQRLQGYWAAYWQGQNSLEQALHHIVSDEQLWGQNVSAYAPGVLQVFRAEGWGA